MAKKVVLKGIVLLHSRFCDAADDVLRDFYLVEEEGTGKKYPVCVPSVSNIMPNPLNDPMQSGELLVIRGRLKKIYSVHDSGKTIIEGSDTEMQKSFLGTSATFVVPHEVEAPAGWHMAGADPARSPKDNG